MNALTTYTHVEDYLELLAGYYPTSTIGITLTAVTPKLLDIHLARYDVAIVESMANHTMIGGSLTDKQADLTVALILKYRRQFARAGIDVTPVENPVYRLPIRTINRSKKLWIENDNIFLRFPYDKKLISDLNEFKKSSQGHAVYKNMDKVWEFGVTESNISWLVTWSALNNIDVDSEISRLFELILEAEKEPYEIKLVKTPDGVEITNAADSLIEYINENLGGINLDNLASLIDYAGVFGYTIDDAVLQCAKEKYSSALLLFGEERQIQVTPSIDSHAMDTILDYAEAANRYPICIYDPGLGNEFDFSRFDKSEIIKYNYSGKPTTSDYDINNVKLVYANKIPATWNHPVPLLVSTVEMMYGGKRMEWLNRAEKVIFYCNTKLKEIN